MEYFFKTGLWIPLFFFLAAFFFSIGFLLKGYRNLKIREKMMEGHLNNGLTRNLAAFERLKKGKDLLNQGLRVEAVEEIEKAKELNPSLADLYFILAKAYGEVGKTSLAIRNLHHFLKLAKPYSSERDKMISMAHEYLKELEKNEIH